MGSFGVRMMSEAVYLEVDAGVRYWENARINGEEDSVGDKMPFRNGDRWQPVIRISDGVVMNWPKGMTASIHYKVCDDGEYFLQDANGSRIRKYKDYYVPEEFLCHGDKGYGDYIIFSIGPDGEIEKYRRPAIDAEYWIES